jgi:hypothetical protein
MKRSEALKIIKKELEKNFEKSKTLYPSVLEFALISHDILFRFEQLGMLPPETRIKRSFYEDPVLVNEWEPEDE